jgi:hypothetical protein
MPKNWVEFSLGLMRRVSSPMPRSWDKLDRIMQPFSPRLRDDLRLTPPASNHLASTIAADVLALPHEALRAIRDSDRIGLQRRIDNSSHLRASWTSPLTFRARLVGLPR